MLVSFIRVKAGQRGVRNRRQSSELCLVANVPPSASKNLTPATDLDRSESSLHARQMLQREISVRVPAAGYEPLYVCLFFPGAASVRHVVECLEVKKRTRD